MSAGRMAERLVLLTTAPASAAVASITRASTTATVTTSSAHGFTTGEYVTIAGAAETAYNGRFKVTVTSTTVFTYTVSGSPASPATTATAITATYYSDAQGGRDVAARTLATVWAELLPPTRTSETLQAQGMGSQSDYRFRIRARSDVVPTLTATWTPRWPPDASTLTVQIHGVTQDASRAYQVLDCGVRT